MKKNRLDSYKKMVESTSSEEVARMLISYEDALKSLNDAIQINGKIVEKLYKLENSQIFKFIQKFRGNNVQED